MGSFTAKISTLLLLVAFYHLSAQDKIQWEVLNKNGSFRAIDFINKDIGWLAGDQGILKTEDGGNTWHKIWINETVNYEDFDKIDFINESVGWANGIVMRTVDGGRTWSERTVDGEIYAVDENTAYAISRTLDYESILKTSDGGLNWQSILKYRDGAVEAIRFFNKNVGIASCQIMNDRNIVKTSNGGLNWYDITPNSANYKYHYNYAGIGATCFINEDEVIIYGSVMCYRDRIKVPDKAFIIKTSDGGATWEEKLIPEFVTMSGLQFINESSGYFLAHFDSIPVADPDPGPNPIPDPFSNTSADISSNGEIYTAFCYTTDRLESWKRIIEFPEHLELISIYAPNQNTTYAVLSGDTSTYLLSTTNGGAIWQIRQNLPAGEVYYLKDGAWFILNPANVERLGGTVWRSTDKGNSWNIQYYSNRDPFSDVYFLDKSRGFVFRGYGFDGGHCLGRFWGCGCIGYADVTNDGGKTWEPLPFECNYILHSCLFLDNDLGFLLGSCGGCSGSAIFKTIDRGKTWSGQAYDDFQNSDLYFSNDQIGWVAGSAVNLESDTSGAIILGTTDGGNKWDIVWNYPNTEENDYYSLESIHGSGATAWAVGERGMMVKYTEEHQWQLQSGVTDLPLNKVYFSDEQHGWITGGYSNANESCYIVLRTADGGETWQEIPDLKYRINDIYFENNLHGWIVGADTRDRGIIWETSDGGDTWSVQSENLNASLNAIHFHENFGWAVGDNGLILGTANNSIRSINEENNQAYPLAFNLSQNYPNPFNPKTVIRYTLPLASRIDLSVYNLLGEKVATLVSERQLAGQHQVKWDASAFPSGVYLYRLDAGDFIETKKLLLIK